jgi:glutathione synthase/RimK-type ligase-like ATP-grasp enzyme
VLNHVIVVESQADKAWAEGAGTAVTAREYVGEPQRFSPQSLRGGKVRVVNLSGETGYLDLGYYCSLLAEARGHRVIPSVATITTLQRKTLYAEELPELNAALRRDVERLGEPPRAAFTLILFFGQAFDQRYTGFARQVFDRLRCPLLRVEIAKDERWQIRSLKALPPSALSPEQFEVFLGALEAYTRAVWTSPKRRRQPRYSLAVLHNPKEALPPSDARTLRKFQQVGQKLGLGVELIERKDYLKLGEYDGLFVRETTSIDNHTFRFAKKAAREGLAVIDDPVSILRCTNKVYLAELLQAQKLPAPRSVILDRSSVLEAESLGYPLVLKIPDGSFSRGVVKAADRAELQRHARELLKRSELILAQEYMYTKYDWRVGILNRKPLFVSQYMMAGDHWQIVRHEDGGRVQEGGFRTLPVAEAPPAVVETALKAAHLVGDGLYGVDLKQNERGVFVIEINDNPNLERGVEDKVLGDQLYETVLLDFVRRIEAR